MDFKAAKTAPTAPSVMIPFTISGTYVLSGGEKEEWQAGPFHLYPETTNELMLSVADMKAADEAGLWTLVLLKHCLEVSMLEADRAAFDASFRNPKHKIEFETLVDVMKWYYETVTQTPFR